MVEIELGKLKKATVNEFKGRKLLDIRNYYEKDGAEKPTQKGISLTLEQWAKLLHHKDEIAEALGIDTSIDSGDEAKEESKTVAVTGKYDRKGDRKGEYDESKVKPKTEPEEEHQTNSQPSPKKKKLSPERVDAEDLAADID